MASPVPRAIRADIDRLYGLPLGEFTAARNALAARVRKQGDRAAADDIKRLPKPTVPAWAVNLLFRHRPADLDALLDAGAQARAAQRDALARGGASPLRAAIQAQRELVSRVARAAADLMAAAGHDPGAAQLDRVAATLKALSDSPDGRKRLAGGRLTEEVEPPGLEVLAGLAGALPPRARRRELPAPPAAEAPEKKAAKKPAEKAAKKPTKKPAEQPPKKPAKKPGRREPPQGRRAQPGQREAEAEAAARAAKPRRWAEAEAALKRQREAAQAREAAELGKKKAEIERKVRRAAAEVEKLETRSGEATRAAAEATRAAADARRQAEKAERQAEAAQAKADRAAERLDQERQALDALERELRELGT